MKLYNKRFQLHLEVEEMFCLFKKLHITQYITWNLIQRIHKIFHIQKLPTHIENLYLADCYGCDVGRVITECAYQKCLQSQIIDDVEHVQ